MAPTIVVLEDNEDRIAAMRAVLQAKWPRYSVAMFETASGVIEFLKDALNDAIVISLDHDLELRPDGSGRMIDGGTGREVADYLASHKPVCPVVIHTTNSPAPVGMEMVLQEAGWKTYRVVPFDDLEWIPTDWKKAIGRAIKTMTRRQSSGEIP
jgi:CheY-like chemotaxis protein